MPSKPHPTLVCMIQIMKMITLAISWQIRLPQHTWKGTSAEGVTVSPPAGCWQWSSWSSGGSVHEQIR